ncbi:MAG: hypothetical protein K9G26_04980 [Emcibacter sp.]|nr:hypothetical protein [Emcibacter sp.]
MVVLETSVWEIDYLGWSGFHIHHACHEGKNLPHIYVDPPKGTKFSAEEEGIIFITHGHPEHLIGAMEYLTDITVKSRTVIVASQQVCQYLAQINQRTNVDFIIAQPEQQLKITAKISVQVFEWHHMPLLPPGVGAALRHIFQILRKIGTAWRIIRMSLKGPKGAGKMLGYILRLSGGKDIIVYGEGLHRRCQPEDVAAIGRKALGATLLVASEPEDIAELPDLIFVSGAHEAILYEPHRPWRDIFELPHANLQALRKVVMETGINTIIPNCHTGKAE